MLGEIFEQEVNTNIMTGAREGLIDSKFVGGFLGKDADIVSKYRYKETRKLNHIQGDYYIAPGFLDKVSDFFSPFLSSFPSFLALSCTRVGYESWQIVWEWGISLSLVLFLGISGRASHDQEFSSRK